MGVLEFVKECLVGNPEGLRCMHCRDENNDLCRLKLLEGSLCCGVVKSVNDDNISVCLLEEECPDGRSVEGLIDLSDEREREACRGVVAGSTIRVYVVKLLEFYDLRAEKLAFSVLLVDVHAAEVAKANDEWNNIKNQCKIGDEVGVWSYDGRLREVRLLNSNLTGIPARSNDYSGNGVERWDVLPRRVVFLVVDYDDARRCLVVSRKAWLDKKWRPIQKGNMIKGKVVEINDLSVVVDIGVAECEVPMREISRERIAHPSDVVSMGQEIDVKVLYADRERNQVSLSIWRAKEATNGRGETIGEMTAALCRLQTDVPIIIDGSNVVRRSPTLKTKMLRLAVTALRNAGYKVYVVFDANICYALKEIGDADGELYLKELQMTDPDMVKIVPAGSQADDFILAYANIHGNHIVSDDQYLQYRDKYPWLNNRSEDGRRVHKVDEMAGEVMLPTIGVSIPIS